VTQHNGFSKSLSAISAAAAAVVDKAQQEADQRAMEKEVAERLPLKAAMRDLLAQLDAELNRQLQAAIERFLGAPVTDPEILRGRLVHGHYPDDPGLTYLIDDTPILWVGEAAIQREGDELKCTREIRQLQAGEAPG
jgi:hypothetical protein